MIYEIKANWQKDTELNKKKFSAASDFCEKNNYIFIIKTEFDIPSLTKGQIKKLETDGIIKLDNPSRLFGE